MPVRYWLSYIGFPFNAVVNRLRGYPVSDTLLLYRISRHWNAKPTVRTRKRRHHAS